MTYSDNIVHTVMLKGTAVAPGIGAGKAWWYRPESGMRRVGAEDAAGQGASAPQSGLAAFRSATRQAAEEIRQLAEEFGAGRGAEEAGIFEAQLLYLEDPLWLRETENLIEKGRAPQEAVMAAADKFAAFFMASGDPLLQERAADIRDVAARIAAIIDGRAGWDGKGAAGGRVTDAGDDNGQGIVLLADEIYPSLAAVLDPVKIRGLVTGVGGYTSHAAIIARALGIPAVMGVGGLLHKIEQGVPLMVDGGAGEVWLNRQEELPRAPRVGAMSIPGADARPGVGAGAGAWPGPVYTADGKRVLIAANAGSPAEARLAREAGAAGIGLYRTEYAYLERDRWPEEDELYAEYAAVMDLWPEGEVVFRTFDLGGDKLPRYITPAGGDNPMLGDRGIRLYRRFPEHFATQLKALLKAAGHCRVKIMVPLVGGLEEFRWARATLQEVRRESEYNAEPPLGMMVEVPAAALQLSRFADVADFFSLGTNDLAQYALAADRTRDNGSYLHPGFLRLLQIAVMEAQGAGRPVSICGEMAGDVRTLPILLGLGIADFSIGIDRIPDMWELVCGITLEGCRETARKALQLATAEEVDELLD